MMPSEPIIQTIQSWLKSFDTNVVVAIPIYNAVDDVLECVSSLLSHTPVSIPIIAVDDCSPDTQIKIRLSAIDDARFLYIRKPENKGFVDTVNLIFSATQPHDVVVINSDTVFPANWLERLQTAAYHRSNIATAIPFTNHGTIVSLPERNHPTGNLPEGLSLDAMDERIRENSLRLRPILPTAIGHCIYFRRSALNVVGYFDEIFAPGYGEEVDFSQRALLAGFSHVLADDLFIFHKGSRSFSAEREKIQRAHEKIINQRYPWYRSAASDAAAATDSPLARAIERAQAAITHYRIALDATCINGKITGTQKLTLELLIALTRQRQDSVHLSIIVQDGIGSAELHGLDAMVDAVIPVSNLQTAPFPVFDLVHRSFQVRGLQDYAFLTKIARRLVISQLDFIAYANPGYVENVDKWRKYQHVTDWVLSAADGVIFISHDVAADAEHRGIIVALERQQIISPGVDHHIGAKYHAKPPSGFSTETPFLLMLGTDFQHKNRIFGLKLLQQLIQEYQWNGSLVIAGPTVTKGSSHTAEMAYLRDHPDLEERVVYLPPVSEAEKHWLMEHAALLLYPSTYEGFGIVPFEAAEANTPVLASRMTSLAEVLGDQVIALDSFDPVAGAAKAWQLLSDDRTAAQQISAIQEQAKNYTWEIAARQTWDFYHRILSLPPQSRQIQLQQMMDDGLMRTFIARNPKLGPWRQRAMLGVWLLSTQGPRGLWRETYNFFRWILRR